MKHRHRWKKWGERFSGEFTGKQTFVCKCGAVMFEGVLEPER